VALEKHLILILTYTERLKPAGSETMQKTSIAILLAGALVTAVATAQAQKEPPPVPSVKVGSVAPDFTLVEQGGQPHSLHDYRGKKNVIVAFYLWAFSPT
jgi:cytochrome oxidase Cu insertion factor (SCO1/SenC/PrrC family)